MNARKQCARLVVGASGSEESRQLGDLVNAAYGLTLEFVFTPKRLHSTAQGRASRTLGIVTTKIHPTPKGLHKGQAAWRLSNPFRVEETGRSDSKCAAATWAGCNPLRGKEKKRKIGNKGAPWGPEQVN